jgi:hypothetical protein
MESTTVSLISHFGARPETGFSRKAVRTICDQRSATRLLAKAMQIIVLSVDHQSLPSSSSVACGSVGVRREARPRGTICG